MENSQQQGLKDSFRHILESSASRYKGSGPHLLRATTGIQTGRDAFEKSRLVMTFSTNMGVTAILCSFRGKAGKVISESSRLLLGKVSSKQFCFLRWRRKHLRAIKQRKYSRFTFAESTISNFPKVTLAKFLGSDTVFCFISISKFGSFKSPFATITSLSELHFTDKRFILLVQTKEVVSMTYGSSTSSWKPWRWMGLDLIITIGDLYINSKLDPLT